MKFITLTIFLLACSLNTLNAQVDTLVASDGTIITFKLLYDDPKNTPKYEININPLCFLLAYDEGNLCLNLNPRYKFSDKFYADANLLMPYARAVDGLRKQAISKEIEKTTIDFTILGHYLVSYKEKTKDKAITLKRVPTHDGYTAYRVPHKRIKGMSLFLDGGINYFQSNLNLSYHDLNTSTYPTLNSRNSTSLTLGGTFNITESYSFVANGSNVFNWNRISFYARANIGLLNKKEIYTRNTIYDNTGSITGYEAVPTNAYDDIFKMKNFGYRLGMDITFGLYSKRIPFTFGFESGKTGFIYSPDEGKFLPASYISFHLGFGIVKFNK